MNLFKQASCLLAFFSLCSVGFLAHGKATAAALDDGVHDNTHQKTDKHGTGCACSSCCSMEEKR